MQGPCICHLPSMNNFQSISAYEYESLSGPEYLGSDLACPFWNKRPPSSDVALQDL